MKEKMMDNKGRESLVTGGPDYDAMLTKLSRELADQGRLVEAGWLSLQKVWLDQPPYPEGQLRDLRWA